MEFDEDLSDPATVALMTDSLQDAWSKLLAMLAADPVDASTLRRLLALRIMTR